MSASTNHEPLTAQIENRAKELGQHALEAVTSLAWLWPFRGIIFAVTNPRLFGSIRPALLKSMLLSSAIFVALLFFTYVPQAAFLVIFTGPLAPIIAFILVLAESVLALTFFAKPLFLEPALTGVFDATLIAQGQRELVVQGRKRLGGGGLGGGKKEIGKALVRPLQGFSPQGIFKYILSLPLNFIPAVGTAFFVLYNGSREGPGWHMRYFQLKGLTKQQRQAFIEKKRPAYTAFGTSTLLLNLIPIVGLVFSFTNTIGAALWAASLEANENLIDGQNEGSEIAKDK